MKHPIFCNDCHAVKECKQKQFMLANTEPIEGFADFELADLVCITCFGDKKTGYESIDQTEFDSPPHCSICGIPLIHEGLTSDGVEYIKETTASGIGCCRELWPVLFEDYLS